jgi:aspartyl-tRNA(Asn)/glutamyl-tRNA(Gln) amidotransferase subunit B
MYQSFVGLETHIHLSTKSKMFCGCKAHFGDEPNTNVCPVCLGYPGVLPVVNMEAVRLGYLVAKALNCELSPISVFERKNYFYPDMPKNYQISQFEHPVGKNGWVDVPTSKGIKRIRIHDVHLEEDAGKMIHAGDMTLIDYNRAGYPLLEIVTEPDLENGEEAEEYLKNFQRIVPLPGCFGWKHGGRLLKMRR